MKLDPETMARRCRQPPKWLTYSAVRDENEENETYWIKCYIISVQAPSPVNVCYPSPCGPNSQCREINEQAVCSCLPTYNGEPPYCKAECLSHSDCLAEKACLNQKCIDPCPGPCGQKADCRVFHHNPICSCRSGFTGDPFTRCYSKPGKKKIIPTEKYYRY